MILCESLIDALSFWCAGYRNVTAAYGTAGFAADHGPPSSATGWAGCSSPTTMTPPATPRPTSWPPSSWPRHRVLPGRLPLGRDANDVAVAPPNPRRRLGRCLGEPAGWDGHRATLQDVQRQVFRSVGDWAEGAPASEPPQSTPGCGQLPMTSWWSRRGATAGGCATSAKAPTPGSLRVNVMVGFGRAVPRRHGRPLRGPPAERLRGVRRRTAAGRPGPAKSRTRARCSSPPRTPRRPRRAPPTAEPGVPGGGGRAGGRPLAVLLAPTYWSGDRRVRARSGVVGERPRALAAWLTLTAGCRTGPWGR